jgi:zinc protease
MTRLPLALLALALPMPAVAQAAPARPAAVQPLAYTERTLPNGLRVYALRDPTTANVAVQVWYDVGGRDDPKGRSGFAHLFEHLMFKATRNLAAEQFDRLTEDVGGNNNASTNDDYTNYYEVVPANHLQRLLFAEADRMASLVIDAKSFASERDVVKEEYRSSVLAQPYGKLFGTYFPAATYRVHPYARGVIGNIAELDAATIDDVRAFHATYYRPDNAVLVVSGNFDPAELDRWVDRYFGPIRRPARAIPRLQATEPVRAAAARYTAYEPNTPLPAVLLSFPVPPDRHPDNAALAVLNAVLSQGESSRLYRSLVYRDQLAQSVQTFLDSRAGPGAFAALAIMAGGKDPAAGEAALRRELQAVRERPVTAAELAEAKNEILTGILRQRETAAGKAFALARGVLIDGDPAAEDKQLAAVAAVTAADVQRVARTYLADARAATIRYLSSDAKPAGAPQSDLAIAPTVVALPLAVPPGVEVVTPATAAERVAVPAPGPAVATAVPRPVEAVLPNGLRVITVERHALPLVTIAAIGTGGAALDPAGRAGAASLAAELLTKGTATRSATAIAAEVEALGGQLSADADRDGTTVSLTVKADQVEPATAILADVVQHPAFAPAELERARAQAIDAATLVLKDPGDLSRLAANRLVFGDGAYGAPVDGTPATLKAVTRADVTASYAATWSPSRTALVVTGDVTPGQARALAERAFGGWRAIAPAAAAPAAAATGTPAAPRIVVVDLPDAGQAGVVVARPAIARRDPAYYPGLVANAVFGGGYSSRINQEVRIKRGLAYGAGSALDTLRAGGSFVAATQTKNPSAPEVVDLMLAEMTRLGTDPAPASDELDARKAVLVGGFGRRSETTVGLAGLVADRVVQDVPLDDLQRYLPSVAAVDAAAVRAAAARLLDPKGASVVVVGDAKQFLPALKARHPKVEVIPASALDLGTPALR